MTVSQHGSISSATNANVSTSLSCNKPSSTASGDLLVAHVTANNGTITSSGWTRLAHTDGGNPNIFDTSIMYKVAGGSEPSSYSFANNSSGAPMVITITAYSGVDTSNPFNGHSCLGSGAQSEPFSTGTCTNSATGLPIYFRAAKNSSASGSSDVPTFTNTSGLTEIDDRGIWSTGTVAYGHVVLLGSAETASSPTAVNITCSKTESDNIYGVYVLKTLITNVSVSMPTPPDAAAAALDATVQTGVAAQAGVASGTTADAYDIKVGVQAAIDTTATAFDATIKGHVVPECATATADAGGIGAYYHAPPGRTVRVGREGRSYSPAPESRVYTVETGGVD